MSTAVKRVRLAEYGALDQSSTLKNEYYRGEVFAIAGGSARHSLISTNIASELRQALKDRPCLVFNSDLRIKVQESGLYTYPDVTVVCGQFEYDRGTKASHYRRIKSLLELVLVSQKDSSTETYVRQADGAWLLREARSLEDHVRFEALGVTLALNEIYRGVAFESEVLGRQ